MLLSLRKATHQDVESLCILMEELSGHPMSADQMANRLGFVEGSAIDQLFVCEEGSEEVVQRETTDCRWTECDLLDRLAFFMI